MATTMCPRGTTIESRRHRVREGGINKEERDTSEEEMMKLDVCDMEEFGKLAARKRSLS